MPPAHAVDVVDAEQSDEKIVEEGAETTGPSEPTDTGADAGTGTDDSEPIEEGEVQEGDEKATEKASPDEGSKEGGDEDEATTSARSTTKFIEVDDGLSQEDLALLRMGQQTLPSKTSPFTQA